MCFLPVGACECKLKRMQCDSLSVLVCVMCAQQCVSVFVYYQQALVMSAYHFPEGRILAF